jgi:hypothetical protein
MEPEGSLSVQKSRLWPYSGPEESIPHSQIRLL